MKRSSVFVLWILIIAFTSCGEEKTWTPSDLAGTFTLTAEEKPIMDRFFSSDASSGWDYYDPYDLTIVLCKDSSYRETTSDGGFETPSFEGLWWIANDTIILLPSYEIDRDCYSMVKIYLDSMPSETFIIQSENALEVYDVPGIVKGRTVLRR